MKINNLKRKKNLKEKFVRNFQFTQTHIRAQANNKIY